MTDIRKITQAALDALPIYSGAERHVGQDIPDEYIIYSLGYSRKANYADNRATARTFQVDVSYFTRDVETKAARTEEIISAMEAAGFRTINAGMDIAADVGAMHSGVAMEFSYWGWG